MISSWNDSRSIQARPRSVILLNKKLSKVLKYPKFNLIVSWDTSKLAKMKVLHVTWVETDLVMLVTLLNLLYLLVRREKTVDYWTS